MRHALAVLAFALAACGSTADPAGPGSTPPPGGNPPGPAPAGPLPSIGGCQIFPADNAWNRDVSADPVHPSSGALLARMLPDHAIHLDLGTTEEYYGIPYTVVPADQPLVPITYGTGGADYSDESDPGPMPIPLDVHIEGGSAEEANPGSGDRHVLVMRQGDCRLFELFNSVRTGSGFQVSSSAVWDLTSNHTRPPGWTSADAAGLPIFPGLVRYDEVQSGAIEHAIRFTAPQTRDDYVWPARHYASSSSDPDLPPMGQRFRLKTGFDISGYSPDVRVILTAMKRYGIILADNGSPWYISGAPDERWDNDMLRELKEIPGSAFEAVDASGMMIDPESGRARQP